MQKNNNDNATLGRVKHPIGIVIAENLEDSKEWIKKVKACKNNLRELIEKIRKSTEDSKRRQQEYSTMTTITNTTTTTTKLTATTTKLTATTSKSTATTTRSTTNTTTNITTKNYFSTNNDQQDHRIEQPTIEKEVKKSADNKHKDGKKEKTKNLYEKMVTGITTTNQRFRKTQQKSITNSQTLAQ